jgi:hypothetical protein
MTKEKNYEDILETSWDDVPQVKLLPVGSWLLKVRNASFQPPKKEDQSPSVLIVYTAKEPMDDVSDEELAELGEDYDFGENRLFVRFWIETGADKDNLRKHIEKHGIETKGMTFAETLKALKGNEVIAYVAQKSFQNAAGVSVVENTATNFQVAE